MGFVGTDLWRVRQKWGPEMLLWCGVAMVVTNERGEILLGQRADTGQWAILGGYFELDDSAESCARRELLEETGLMPQTSTLFGVLTEPERTYFRYPNGDQVRAPSFLFAMEVDDEPATTDDEHTGWQWMKLPDLLKQTENLFGISSATVRAFAQWRATGVFQIG